MTDIVIPVIAMTENAIGVVHLLEVTSDQTVEGVLCALEVNFVEMSDMFNQVLHN